MNREMTKLRLDRMLGADGEEINDATRAAVEREFGRVAREYFETDEVRVLLKKAKSGTDVTVSFHASRIKNFSPLK